MSNQEGTCQLPYQACLAITKRLRSVPKFGHYILQLQKEDKNAAWPVYSLWNLLKTGTPLLVIYNATSPAEPLGLDPDAEEKFAIIMFLDHCVAKLKISTEKVFIVADLLGDSLLRFKKVLTAVNAVLDIAESRGNMGQAEQESSIAHFTHRTTYLDCVIRELVDTERNYVQDLETLWDLKKALKQQRAISGNVLSLIFLNLDALLEFQHRFLVEVEMINSKPTSEQRWGALFWTQGPSFSPLYHPFLANEGAATEIARSVFDKIQATNHPVARDYKIFDGLLVKPMQRLSRYPLLLKELVKHTDGEIIKKDLAAGIEAAERIAREANKAVDRSLLEEALEQLVGRVVDWKNHDKEAFGDLLLHGSHTVVTGKKDQGKENEIYLFELLLLCCKGVTTTKTKDIKNKTYFTDSVRNKNKLRLKECIYMKDVTDVSTFLKNGLYMVQIRWKGDTTIESLAARFSSKETAEKWATGLDRQRDENGSKCTRHPGQSTANLRPLKAQDEDEMNPQQDPEGYSGKVPPPSETPYNPASGSRRLVSENLQRWKWGPTASPPGIGSQDPEPRIPVQKVPTLLPSHGGRHPKQSPTQRGAAHKYYPETGASEICRTSSVSTWVCPRCSGQLLENGCSPYGRSRDHSQFCVNTSPSRSTRGEGLELTSQTSTKPISSPSRTQFNFRVKCDKTYIKLSVGYDVTYQDLSDRIKAELSRFTGLGIGTRSLELRYIDGDGDFINIENDEDIQNALLDLREASPSTCSHEGDQIEFVCI